MADKQTNESGHDPKSADDRTEALIAKNEVKDDAGTKTSAGPALTPDMGSVWAPGGDSHEEMTDPAGAEFVSIADSPMMTTMRDPASMPPLIHATTEEDQPER